MNDRTRRCLSPLCKCSKRCVHKEPNDLGFEGNKSLVHWNAWRSIGNASSRKEGIPSWKSQAKIVGNQEFSGGPIPMESGVELGHDFQGNRTICIPIVDVPHSGGQFAIYKFRSIFYQSRPILAYFASPEGLSLQCAVGDAKHHPHPLSHSLSHGMRTTKFSQPRRGWAKFFLYGMVW